MELFIAMIMMMILFSSLYRFSSLTNSFYPELKQALINDRKISHNDIMNFIDYMNERIPSGYMTYKIERLYDLDDSIELREIKTRIIKTVTRERILPFITGCIYIPYMIYLLFF